MKVSIAPNKVKGSLTDQEVATAIRDGILTDDQSVACEPVPLVNAVAARKARTRK